MFYERILAHVAATPWAIEPGKGEVVAEILNRKLRGETAPRGELDEYLAREAARREKDRDRSRRGAVALVPLYGVMTQRADLFTEMSGMASTETVGRQIDEAAADRGVEVIVMDIDSPGGSVFGVPELADKVAAAAKQKKVIAVANSLAASGAYWVASQASELVVTQSGEIGSVGVYMMHVDRSEEIKAMGRVVTFVSAGERKTALAPTQPLSTVGRQQLEELVQGTYGQFVRAVAKGRNVSQTRVREGFGRGGMVLAENAVEEGMADRVASLDQVLARYGVSLADVAPNATAPEHSDRHAVEIRKRRLNLA
jgi:capsid assembly protease